MNDLDKVELDTLRELYKSKFPISNDPPVLDMWANYEDPWADFMKTKDKGQVEEKIDG